jgi:lipoprotein-anchoring transpeptidase ErfK/SrfK
MVKKSSPKSSKKFLYFEILPVALILAIGIIYLSAQQFNKNNTCGCGTITEDTNGEFEKTEEVAIFNNQKVKTEYAYTTDYLATNNVVDNGFVLGTNTDEKWIEVDLSDQRLYARNGNNIDYELKISSGKWAPTPTGDFRIWAKLRYTKMSGGDKAKNTYYYLPNVPYVQYFYKGYGLHGAYWHNNFGQPMSHGCVNLSVLDAEKLFSWTVPIVPDNKTMIFASKDNSGTRVVIHE